ncbi:DNA mismatch repair protein MutS [Labrys sp. WJW]|uniref:MutS-related protein n=1 Tax=Labrys sp. WJW TaxID=1737983 RepID=UPI00082EEC35|nr:DNA mismatch repair protein MutS [Labrys sp. WJW]OCC05454.1 DNA mismatch repair protein MutS [Labrys sp. WJW]
MTVFDSILYDLHSRASRSPTAQEPDFFKDLNLDQIVAAIVSGRDEYDLTPFFREPPLDLNTIYYRHEIMKDLEQAAVHELVSRFSRKMQTMRTQTARSKKFYYKFQKEWIFLDAVQTYCEAIVDLQDSLLEQTLRSRGLMAFRDYLKNYVETEAFCNLRAALTQLRKDLADVIYLLLIRDSSITVCRFTGERDYGAKVLKTFEKFRQGDAKAFEFKLHDFVEMNHIEAGVLDFVAKHHPAVFERLDRFVSDNEIYIDPTVGRFEYEIQFYVAYLEYVAPLRRAGLSFCYPKLVTSKDIAASSCFDLALAAKLVGEKNKVVTNDFHLAGFERVFVVSGPNQGGKTTFARTFGQMHFLARLGCPVPGTSGQLFFYDQLFSHFEKEEDIRNHRSKLEDDLVRVHSIIERATTNSIVILNEIFTSTTLKDAMFLGRQILQRIIDLDLLCVCVTFMDELSVLSEQTVSMVSTVVPDRPAQRTYRVVRRTADGRAYALSIAEKYRLTYETLKERLAS